MGEDISDAKTQPIQDGTNPNFSNVDAGTDGTELGVNKRDKTSLFTESASDEANLYTQKNDGGIAEAYLQKHIESSDFIVEDQFTGSMKSSKIASTFSCGRESLSAKTHSDSDYRRKIATRDATEYNELLGYLKSKNLEELANQEIREDALDYMLSERN